MMGCAAALAILGLFVSACRNPAGMVDVSTGARGAGNAPVVGAEPGNLIAGRTSPVGRVVVTNDAEHLSVKYSLDAGWRMTESHLAVATEAAGIPQTKTHNPIPGQFPHAAHHEPAATEYEYVLDLKALQVPPGKAVLIAAHAEVERVEGGAVVQRESAWAAGIQFEGQNWATYFEYVPTLTSPHTISGKVTDSITGGPIEGATIVLGSCSATTDATGAYVITVDPSVSSITGVFAAYKGLAYAFRICGSTTVDLAADRVYNVSLAPFDISGYQLRNLSGRIFDGTGVEIPEISEVSLHIYNESGGNSYCSGMYDRAVGGYSVSTPTYGDHCTVEVNIREPLGDTFRFYCLDQKLPPDSTAYNLTIPGSGFTSVTVGGTLGTMFWGNLVLPGGARAVMYASGMLFDSPSATVEIYNPGDFPISWWTIGMEMGSPGPGDMTMRIHAAQMDFSPVITLPPAAAAAGPAGTVDPSTVAWDGGTLSFGPVTGANAYYTVVLDDNGHAGFILTAGGEIALPGHFVSSVLAAGSGWDLTVGPAWMASPAPGELLPLALSIDMASGGNGLEEFEAVSVSPGVVTKVDAL